MRRRSEALDLPRGGLKGESQGLRKWAIVAAGGMGLLAAGGVLWAWQARGVRAVLAAEGLGSDAQVMSLGEIPGNLARGERAPDFSVRTIGGGVFSLSEHRAEPTVLFFMASWCITCIAEAESLGVVHERYASEGLNVVVIDVQDGDTDKGLGVFRQAAGDPDYVWAFDDGYSVTQALNVRTLDTTIGIDRAGNIVYYDQYPTPLETLLKVAQAVVQ